MKQKTVMGETRMMATLNKIELQFSSKALAGIPMKVTPLRYVQKMLNVAAHQGMRRPARKKSLVVLLRRAK